MDRATANSHRARRRRMADIVRQSRAATRRTRFVLVLFHPSGDDSVLLTDKTWITFANLERWGTQRPVDIWEFRTARDAARVRDGWLNHATIGIVRIDARWKGCEP